ncbi:hypothetical protein, partial [Pontiella sp.]|uniref:hypothetical protein n=1 Tax=Pontiella sp. TaxID=2837462 RepID=UPI003565F1BE
MGKFVIIVLFLLVGLGGIDASAQGTDDAEASGAAKVTAVYGVTADDYLPAQEAPKSVARPAVRRGGSAISAADLPDAFFFIGVPIFLLLLLYLVVTFLNGFEEKRRE